MKVPSRSLKTIKLHYVPRGGSVNKVIEVSREDNNKSQSTQNVIWGNESNPLTLTYDDAVTLSTALRNWLEKQHAKFFPSLQIKSNLRTFSD